MASAARGAVGAGGGGAEHPLQVEECAGGTVTPAAHESKTWSLDRTASDELAAGASDMVVCVGDIHGHVSSARALWTQLEAVLGTTTLL